MDTNVNYTIVGAFVIILSTFIVLGIIWLSSGFTIQSNSTYMVYMQEAVTGLNIDATVEYNGVNVGSVKSISLNAKNPHLVELLLNIKTGTPITEGTTATLETKGITGITYIALKDKSTNLTPLKAVNDQPYPVIKTSPSLLLRLDTALNKLNTSLSRVSDSIQALLDPDNLRAIKETLIHLNKLTGTLAGNSQRLNNILSNAAMASQQFSPTMDTLSTQTLPKANRTLSNLDAITAEIKNNPSILIRGTQPQPLGPGEE